MIKNLLYLSILFFITGCSTIHHAEKPRIINTPVVLGNVLDSSAFAKGGKIGLLTFKPGPGAAANEQTDRVSLMLIKGIREILMENASAWVVVDEGQEAQGFLDGYVEDFNQSGKISRLILRRNEARLSIDGEIWLKENGLKIFVFQSSRIINLKKEKLFDAAYQMGRAIGEFIISKE